MTAVDAFGHVGALETGVALALLGGALMLWGAWRRLRIPR